LHLEPMHHFACGKRFIKVSYYQFDAMSRSGMWGFIKVRHHEKYDISFYDACEWQSEKVVNYPTTPVLRLWNVERKDLHTKREIRTPGTV
jgi:hypothetical protein